MQVQTWAIHDIFKDGAVSNKNIENRIQWPDSIRKKATRFIVFVKGLTHFHLCICTLHQLLIIRDARPECLYFFFSQYHGCSNSSIFHSQLQKNSTLTYYPFGEHNFLRRSWNVCCVSLTLSLCLSTSLLSMVFLWQQIPLNEFQHANFASWAKCLNGINKRAKIHWLFREKFNSLNISTNIRQSSERENVEMVHAA